MEGGVLSKNKKAQFIKAPAQTKQKDIREYEAIVGSA